MKNNLEKLAKQLATKYGFKIEKKIYQANYYRDNQPRNAIFFVNYHGKKAALKIYDDPRETDEPFALARFNRINKSKILLAPKLYKAEIISAKRGWFIMERLPASAKAFHSPPVSKSAARIHQSFFGV